MGAESRKDARLTMDRDVLEAAIVAELQEFFSGTSIQGWMKISASSIARYAVSRALAAAGGQDSRIAEEARGLHKHRSDVS